MVADTWNSETASWATAADWSLGTVPDVDDAVVIDQGEPEIDSAVGTVASLTNMGDVLVEAGGGLIVSTALDTQGDLIITGGNLTVRGDLQNGNLSDLTNGEGASGNVQLSGGSLIVIGDLDNEDNSDLQVTGGSLAVSGTLTNTGDFEIQGGAAVTVGRGLSNGDDTTNVDHGDDFVVDCDVDASGAGGSRLTVDGVLANDDTLTIGNSAMTATSLVTAGTFTQLDLDREGGVTSAEASTLDLSGGATDAAMAILDVTSAASLSGDVNLSGHALLEFASGEIATISIGSELTLNGANAYVADSSATTSNSALTALDELYGGMSLRNGASVAPSGALTVDDLIIYSVNDELLQGSLSIDASSGDGGSELAIAGALTNYGDISLGNGTLSSADLVTAASFANVETSVGVHVFFFETYYGAITITGSATHEATLDIAGAAGFGTAGTVVGGVSLYDDALIEFGSSEITDIAAFAQLTLGGSMAYVADASDVTSNSALTGLTTVTGALTLDNGAVVKPTGALTVTGELNVDTGPYGGSLLAIGAGLTNQGTISLGDNALTSSDMISAASLSNSGAIDIVGGRTSSILATLDIAGDAGFGTGSALTGTVNLVDDALLEFGSGEIGSIAANSFLTENGRQAFVADASNTSSNSALTGLATISGELVLYNGAAVSTGALTVAAGGSVDLDGGVAVGGSSLAVSGMLTNGGTISVGNLGTSSNDSVTASALSNTGLIALASGFSANTKLLIDGAASNSGTIDDSEYDVVTISGALSGDGTINVSDGGQLSVGSGGGGGTVAFGAAGGSIVVTSGGTLGDAVSGFAGGDTIEFADVAYSAAETVNLVGGGAGKETFAIDDGPNDPVAEFTVAGSYVASQFALSDDGGDLLVSSAPALFFTNAAELPDSTTETLTGAIDVADAGLTIKIYDGATQVGTTTANSSGYWSVTVTLAGSSPHVLTARATTAGGATAISSAQVLAVGGGETIDLTGGPGSAASLYDTAGDFDNLYGSGGTVYLTSAQAALTGGGDNVYLSGGSGDAASFYDTGGDFDNVHGSGGTFYLVGAQAALTGGGNIVDLAGGSGNAASFYDTSGDWDQVNGSGGTVYLIGAQAAVTGGGDTVDFISGAGNAVSLYNTSGDWDSVNGSGGTVYLFSAQAVVTGGGDAVNFAGGSGNAVTLANTAGDWDAVNGSGGTVYLTGGQVVVSGGGDTAEFVSGAGDAVTVSNTSGNWDSVKGSGGTVYLTNGQAVVNGGGDAVDFVSGAGNAATLSGTSGNWDSVTGAGATVYFTGAQAVIAGGGDKVDFVSGTGNAATLSNTAGDWDSVTGSNATVYLEGAQAGVAGSSDTINLDGSSVTQSGASDAFVFQPKFGEDVIYGFASSDTMQFSTSDFANYAALSPHVSQAGANTEITLDSADSVTLENVLASSLSASQFHFV